ncbi:Uncharacterized protein HZ326_28536 [Fusarium oxysporum f. sp. albedinis]|nr:Uncharacterized protein HZ326_28536 [Fusarium oxysporum f. sp. albedinis]
MDIRDTVMPGTTTKRNWMGWVGSAYGQVGNDSTLSSRILIREYRCSSILLLLPHHGFSFSSYQEPSPKSSTHITDPPW